MYKKNVLIIFIFFGICYCNNNNLTKVTLVLDYTPNTNHTGFYVAQALNFYQKQHLNVNIIQPYKNSADIIVSLKRAEFAISSSGTLIRERQKKMPLVSIAAIIQHNTSGFYSLKERRILRPADFINKIYGGWGSNIEYQQIQTLMKKDGVHQRDIHSLKMVTIGSLDVLTALKNVDFLWGYEAWQGEKLKHYGIAYNYIPIIKYSKDLDEYTPILITHQNMLNNSYKREIVYRFVQATRLGFEYAIKHPKKSAQILTKYVDGLDATLILKSQQYISQKYQEDAPYWGYQNWQRYQNYSDWLYQADIITNPLNKKNCFVTNVFLSKDKPHFKKESLFIKNDC